MAGRGYGVGTTEGVVAMGGAISIVAEWLRVSVITSANGIVMVEDGIANGLPDMPSRGGVSTNRERVMSMRDILSMLHPVSSIAQAARRAVSVTRRSIPRPAGRFVSTRTSGGRLPLPPPVFFRGFLGVCHSLSPGPIVGCLVQLAAL